MGAKRCPLCQKLYHNESRKHKCPKTKDEHQGDFCLCEHALPHRPSKRKIHFQKNHYQCPGCKDVCLGRQNKLHIDHCYCTPVAITVGEDDIEKRTYEEDAPRPEYPPTVNHARKLDKARDQNFRDQVIQELQKKPSLERGRSHGDVTDRLVLRLLQLCDPPDDSEADVLTGQEAERILGTGPTDRPIFTEGQQSFSWDAESRPIKQIFERMEDLTLNVSIQVPSRKSYLRSFEKHRLAEVQQRFLESENIETDNPWNLLDLKNPLPPTTMPKCLSVENCQLLLRVRDDILCGNSGERIVAAKERWNEWRDILDWLLLSEGGHNTAPHMDSHGLSTWITIQEGEFGFGWLSNPTREERDTWIANPQEFTGGRWRFRVLTPGKTVIFFSGTIHFVFRLRRGQTLAIGGHFLQWNGIDRWIRVVREQMRSPYITNEDVEWSASKYVGVISDLVENRVRSGRAAELGVQAVVDEFRGHVKGFEEDRREVLQQSKKRKRM